MSAKIYGIQNLINGKWRIGQTYRTLEKRFREYIRDARLYKEKGREFSKYKKFSAAINKYGIDSFTDMILLEDFDEYKFSSKHVDEIETFYINFLNCIDDGYNDKESVPGGRLSKETIKRIIDSRSNMWLIIFDSRRYEIIKNKNEWCRNNGFSVQNTSRINSGAKLSSSNGVDKIIWCEQYYDQFDEHIEILQLEKRERYNRLILESRKSSDIKGSITRSNNWRITFDNGNIIYVKNLKKFSIENNYSNLANVYRMMNLGKRYSTSNGSSTIIKLEKIS